MQYGTGRWYMQHTMGPAKFRCIVWEGYDVTDDGFKHAVTETFIDGSVAEFCVNVTKVV